MKAPFKSCFSFRLFFRDVKDLFRKSFTVFSWSVILTAFFLFLFHVFAWLSWQSTFLSDTIKDKLGIYFYVRDTSNDSLVYSRIIELQNDLDSYWFNSSFRSKEQALAVLFGNDYKSFSEKIANYGVENPLPATLYVSFNNEAELAVLKKLIYKYRDIISNVWDLDSIHTLKKQEERNVKVISLSHFIHAFSLVILVIMFVTIVTMLLYLLKTLFNSFSHKLEIQTILWSYHMQTVSPYVCVSLITLLLSFLIMIFLLSFFLYFLDFYIFQRFSVDVFANYLLPYRNQLVLFFVYELFTFLLFGSLLSYAYISYLLRRVSYE